MTGRAKKSTNESAERNPPSGEQKREDSSRGASRSGSDPNTTSSAFSLMFGGVAPDIDTNELQQCLVASFHFLMDGMFLLDRDGRIVAMNPSAGSITGFSRKEAVGQRLAELLFPPIGRVRFHKNLSMYLQQGVSGSLLSRRIDEFQVRRSNGGSFPAELTTLPLSASGTISFAVFLRDVSERVRSEKQLRQAKSEADAANRAKSAFLAMMSHDIRTPMNAIIGMTELVLDTKLDDSQREYLEIVHESGESLLTLINDILDFSKIEAGKFVLEEIAFQPREMLADSMKSIALRAREKDVEVACRIASRTPTELIGDPARLRQILVNLAGNAIKFTEHGEVVVHVRPAAQDPGGNQEDRSVLLHFTVSDTGVGIPQDRLAHVFGEFEQADSSTARKFGGSGLGLTIAKRLAELMNGRMWVESEPGHGSDFHFTARFRRIAAETKNERDASWRRKASGKRLLVLSRNETVLAILDEQVSAWGMAARTADRLETILNSCDESSPVSQSFDLVVCDYSNMAAEDFLATLRLTRPDGRHYPVILLHRPGESPPTGAVAARSPQVIKLMKPVKAAELQAALSKGLNLSEMERKEADAPRRPARQLKPLRILLVEDSLVNQKLAIVLLNKRGHSITTAQNGLEAIGLVEQNDFDLVLMDVEMPVMDGIEATAKIREREQETGQHLPIVAMTAHAMKGDQQRFLDAGMDAYVSKPIRTDDLFGKIAALLDAHMVEATPPSSPGEESAIDWHLAQELVHHDLDLLRGVIAVLVQEVPGLFDEVRTSANSGDSRSLQRAAHKLKGSLKCVGVVAATQLAEQLEVSGHNGDLSAVPETFNRLEAALNELHPVLERFLNTGMMEAAS